MEVRKDNKGLGDPGRLRPISPLTGAKAVPETENLKEDSIMHRAGERPASNGVRQLGRWREHRN